MIIPTLALACAVVVALNRAQLKAAREQKQTQPGKTCPEQAASEGAARRRTLDQYIEMYPEGFPPTDFPEREQVVRLIMEQANAR